MSANEKAPWILGISASHNGAACLLRGSEVVVAIQEERLLREKRARIEGASPSLAISYCLDTAGITPAELDLVVCSAQGRSHVKKHDIALNPLLRVAHHNTPYLNAPHHLCHALSAYTASGFKSADLLVIDGQGSPAPDLLPSEQALLEDTSDFNRCWEWLSFYQADGCSIAPLHKQASVVMPGEEIQPFSLGKLFEVASQIVFGDPGQAGKLMGLAPYGKPSIPIAEFLELEGLTLKFHRDRLSRYGEARLWPNHQQEAETLAASVQAALDYALVELAKRLRQQTDGRRLCYSGGVALSSVANEKLIREAGYEDVFIIPAAEDSGVAIGAAYYGLFHLRQQAEGNESADSATISFTATQDDSLGRCYTEAEIDTALEQFSGAIVSCETGAMEQTLDEAAQRINSGQVCAWFQGGSELGPRALGHRSLLADPRSETMKDHVNKTIKLREAFRPFAPAVLAEHATQWFDDGGVAESPFMLRVMPVLAEKRRQIPAVVHVDGSARVQTVPAEGARGSNPYRRLIEAFYRQTGVPILLNTSLNLKGEPLVETPEDTLWLLATTPVDFAVMGGRLLTKAPNFHWLDWTPTRTAIDFKITGNTASNSAKPLGPHTVVEATKSTRWGQASRPVRYTCWKYLEEFDGDRSFRDILVQDGKQPDNPVHLAWWRSIVHELYCCGAFTLDLNL